jgi:septum formation topological specificity factor MinE
VISDTPISDSTPHNVAELGMLCRQLERELNAANERIRLLIAERDTARRQADQQYKLREEFLNLLGTDDVEQGVAVVRDMKQRISKLYDYVAALETGGDLMAHELGFGYDVDLWNKARGEAKP